MLYQLLEEIEQARGPVLVKDLGQKLNIDPGVLMGMIEFWVRKISRAPGYGQCVDHFLLGIG
jgi:hypothetical protein